MTLEGTAESPRRRYPTMTQMLASLHLLLGWAFVAIQRLPARWFDFISGWLASDWGFVIAVLIIAIYILTIRSIPGNEEERESHLTCFCIPALVAAALLVIIAAPVFEMTALALGVVARNVLDIWHGFPGVGLALVLGATLVGPLQFLWRDWQTSSHIAWILLLVVMPLALALPVEIKQFTLASVLLCALALALTTSIVVVGEACRRALEVDAGLRSALLSFETPRTTNAYEQENSVRRVGVAVSGGGYRASLFALGALMYIHDVCTAASATRRKIVVVSSVSGGSITNGLLAHGLKLGKSDRGAFDRLSRILVRHTVRTGSMFAGRNAKLYYTFLLPGAAIVTIFLGWITVRNITWSILLRALAIPAIPIGLMTVWAFTLDALPRIKIKWLDELKVMVAFFAGLATIGVFLHFVLSDSSWRFALAWLGTALLLGLGLAIVWALRGRLIQSNFDSLLREVSDSPRLADAHPDTHHVFCATEVQFDETAYFAQDCIRSRSFPATRPGNLPTALAMRASAALPGAFPPAILSGFKEELRIRFVERDPGRKSPIRHMVLVDGGVRDNLGTSWFDQYAPQLDELVVVSASPNRHSYRRIRRIPGLSEAMSMLNLLNIPYNTRERNRRRAIVGELFGRPWKNGEAAAQGALVHIEDSPFDLATMVKWRTVREGQFNTWLKDPDLEDWDVDQMLAVEQLWAAAGDRAPLLLERAEAVLDHLRKVEDHLPNPPPVPDSDYLDIRAALYVRTRRMDAPSFGGSDQEAAWWKRTEKNSLVGTKLSRIRADDAMNLILHGYYLAMANLHVSAGWPLTKALDYRRLEELFRDVAASPVTTQDMVESAREEVAQLQGRPLYSVYPILNLFSVDVSVRQVGQFVRKEAVLGLALDPDGQLELLGIWMAPSIRDLTGEWHERREVLNGRRKDFWQGVFTNIKDRGCKRILICCSDLPVDRITSFHIFLGFFDEAMRSLYPRTILLPQVSGFVHDSVRWLRLTASLQEIQEVPQDLMEVFRAPTSVVAKGRLEHFREKWGPRNQRYLNIHESWLQHWDKITPLFDFSEETRHLLQTIDSCIDTARQSLQNGFRERGAASSDEVALSQLHRDLRKTTKKWRRVAGWRKRLNRLETESQEWSPRPG